MLALTVRQPWAWAIAMGFKDIENRSWYPRLDPGDLVDHPRRRGGWGDSPIN